MTITAIYRDAASTKCGILYRTPPFGILRCSCAWPRFLEACTGKRAMTVTCTHIHTKCCCYVIKTQPFERATAHAVAIVMQLKVMTSQASPCRYSNRLSSCAHGADVCEDTGVGRDTRHVYTGSRAYNCDWPACCAFIAPLCMPYTSTCCNCPLLCAACGRVATWQGTQ